MKSEPQMDVQINTLYRDFVNKTFQHNYDQENSETHNLFRFPLIHTLKNLHVHRFSQGVLLRTSGGSHKFL